MKTKFTGSTSFTSLSSLVISHESKINIIWLLIGVLGIALAGNIVLLSINLVRENSFHTRVTEIERNLNNYRVELLQEANNYQIEQLNRIKEQDDILNCLKFKKYWQYEQCFN